MEPVKRIVNEFLAELRKLIDFTAAQQLQRMVGGSANVEIHRGRWPTGKLKRSPEKMTADRERVYAVIKAHPGKRSEELQDILHMDAREMGLPLKQLIAKRKLVCKGTARGRRYWAR